MSPLLLLAQNRLPLGDEYYLALKLDDLGHLCLSCFIFCTTDSSFSRVALYALC